MLEDGKVVLLSAMVMFEDDRASRALAWLPGACSQTQNWNFPGLVGTGI
jgi:hypothetical protein